jgi:hypothetical protein
MATGEIHIIAILSPKGGKCFGIAFLKGIDGMSSDSTSTTNPFPTRAGFTYLITPTKLVIKDTGKGAKTVVEDLPYSIQDPCSC